MKMLKRLRYDWNLHRTSFISKKQNPMHRRLKYLWWAFLDEIPRGCRMCNRQRTATLFSDTCDICKDGH